MSVTQENNGGASNIVTTLPAEDEGEIRQYEQCGCQIGCGTCKTKRCTVKCLNCFNNAKGALFFLCFVALFQGIVMNGLINIVISTLERRFNLRSSETGLIASTYDIGSCFSLLFVTYIGGRGHKPMWLGWGTLIMGLGSIVFSLPHFVAPAYSISSAESGCESNSTAICGELSVRAYRGFFILSQLLHGIGATPLYTLALTYLDENVKQCYSSVYHGLFYGVSVIGPGAGYLMGGYLLSYYTNPGEKVEIVEGSTLWVGNWWLGFLIGGLCFFVLSIPVLMYPRQLPGTDAVRLHRRNEMYQSEAALEIDGNQDFGKSIWDAPRCLLILLKNPTIVFLSLAGAMDNGIVAALATFGPKYVESMFTLNASTAAFRFGVLAIVCAFFGQVIGGVVVWKFNFTVPRMLLLAIFQSFIALACFFIFLFNCENTSEWRRATSAFFISTVHVASPASLSPSAQNVCFVGIAGATIPFTGDSEINCALQCGSKCSTELYDPVCGADNLTYLSYCDAGCDRLNSEKFENCTRVLDASVVSSLPNSTATRGKCVVDACSNLMLFLVITALGVFFVFLTAQPALQASLRSVPFSQRSFAIGIQWLILRLLGSIPMPNILGRVLDLACVVWGQECGECGSCNIYDTWDMAKYMVSVIVTAKAVSIVFYFLAWITYKAPKKSTSDDTPLETTASSAKRNKPLPRESEAHENPSFAL